MDPATIPADAAKVEAELQTPQAQAIMAYVEQRLAAVPQVATLEKRLDQVVPGWRTSEFWMTNVATLGLILAACAGALPAKYSALAIALSQAAYSLSRGLAKRPPSN